MSAARDFVCPHMTSLSLSYTRMYRNPLSRGTTGSHMTSTSHTQARTETSAANGQSYPLLGASSVRERADTRWTARIEG